MQNEENAVIRYLMKEMDPSEEVLMERAMMEDDDLLIEVESMRQTMQRMDDLPEKEPPADLTESIVQQAAEHKKQQSRWPSIPTEVYKYAAVLLIGMGMGSGLWLFMDGSPSQPSAEDETAITRSIQQITNAVNGLNFGTNADAEPWVDRDDVIYFQDMYSGQSSSYDNIMQTSMEKLRPVDNSALQANPNARGVQLTGSNN